jgi:hypothetical protein
MGESPDDQPSELPVRPKSARGESGFPLQTTDSPRIVDLSIAEGCRAHRECQGGSVAALSAITQHVPGSTIHDMIDSVMCGPSSAHRAAALRLGQRARDLMDDDTTEVQVAFDRSGSLPTTRVSQRSARGLFGGLLGWDADDERLPDAVQPPAESWDDPAHPAGRCRRSPSKDFSARAQQSRGAACADRDEPIGSSVAGPFAGPACAPFHCHLSLAHDLIEHLPPGAR